MKFLLALSLAVVVAHSAFAADIKMVTCGESIDSVVLKPAGITAITFVKSGNYIPGIGDYIPAGTTQVLQIANCKTPNALVELQDAVKRKTPVCAGIGFTGDGKAFSLVGFGKASVSEAYSNLKSQF